MTTTLTQAATQLSLRAVSGSPFSLLLNLTVTDSGGTPIAWSAVTSPVVVVEDADGKAVPAAVPTVTSPASGQLLLAWTAAQTAAFYTGRWSLSVTISGVGPQALVAGILTMKKSTLPGPSNPTEEAISVEVGTVTVDIDVTIGGSALPVGTTAGTVAAGNDGRIVGAVQRGGDTMTGPLVLPGNPTLALQAAPKQYVDAEQTRATAAEGALQSTIAGLSATPWVANTAYAAEKIVSNGVGLYEAPTGGVPSRATFTASDWTHLADIALPVGTTAGTVAAGDDSRITGAASASALAAEATARASADTALAGSVTSEATTRAAAVTGEATTRAAADTTNATAITNEATTARAAESANATAITSEATTARAAEALLAQALIPTAVKTANYTAVAADLVPCDTTSASFTVTLPNAPADKTRVAVKMVTLAGANTVSVACAGSDVFNKVGGATTATLSLLAQAMQVQYKASTHIWYVVADDLPLPQLDGRYMVLVAYSSGSYPARPTASVVLWTGPTQPPGWQAGDLWLKG